MALLPSMIELSNCYPLYDRWNRFGRGIYPHEFGMLPSSRSLLDQYYTGYQKELDTIPKTSIGKDGFEVSLDVQEFAPDEISVKTVENTIVIEASHEEREDDHGHISRQFKRRYALPKGFNIKDVGTQLSSDGILTIKAPKEDKALEQGSVRVLQIQPTGPVRFNSDNKEREIKGG